MLKFNMNSIEYSHSTKPERYIPMPKHVVRALNTMYM